MMIKILILFFIIFIPIKGFKYQFSSSSIIQEKTVNELISRYLPKEKSSEFEININFDWLINEKDNFEINTLNNHRIQINASSGVAAAWGFYYYLKHYCNCHISWECKQLNIPNTWPNVRIKVIANDRFRYYQNVCTTSYSFVWWKWTDWEKHLDWMAMNAFNLILAPTGQEAIWLRIYKKFNLTKDEINNHFTGPAFLSWFRMGNLRKWGGNLTRNWHINSKELQKKILQRMRDFGMTPVLPAFAGHVPYAFKRIFPKANITKTSKWNKFNESYCCPYLLDPSDKLFRRIGKLFLKEIIKEFGTDNYYSCDTFNENLPNSGSTEYLRNISQAIIKSMTAVDRKAVWLLQSWLFIYDAKFWTIPRVEAFLKAIPKGRLIVLDLQSEFIPAYFIYNSFYGHPYIWCMLHNFGGTLGMYGSSQIINMNVIKARQNSTIIGIGLTPEGINQNYVIYELMLENTWMNQTLNLTSWFAEYSIRRYGEKNDDAIIAWQILQKSVYNFKSLIFLRGKYVVNKRPSLHIVLSSWYDILDLFNVWNKFIFASNHLRNSECFRHDLVDLTRQVLQKLIDVYYGKLIQSFQNKNQSKFQEISKLFLDMFNDMDLILSTNEHFLLGKWLNAAKKAANNSKEVVLYEFNARNQITLWGPNGEINNYASKQWAGMVKDYFYMRWKLFINAMNDSLKNMKPLNVRNVTKQIFDLIERPFSFNVPYKEYPDYSMGDSIEIAKQIHLKWSKIFNME